MYWIRLVREILNWYEVYKIVRDNEELLEEYQLRRDWIGRLYTVINLPEEIASNETAREPTVIGHLRRYDKVLMQLGLTESVFPDLEPIPETTSYLLVLRPEQEELRLRRFIWNIFKWAGILFILRITFNIITQNTEIATFISEFFTKYVL